ncbi:MAG: hypothetical protein GF317_22690 [Candidatus Lokiarchaeota archaeon]|nr:hypothetical protein [Candidatus Lokiarchaeota archaeon]MBD3202274.1 hypothetical protein [Candidatus Lokiarchaeota archaeon]
MSAMHHNVQNLDSLFNPKHIAFIGASENSKFGSMLYLSDFQDSKWGDTFYPVNPNRDAVLKWKCYPSVLDIPYPVDTAYISVKTKIIPSVLRECVEREVKWVIIFASGFSETGKIEGKHLEKELLEIINGSKTNIIGPNCLGPYNGTTGMAFSFAADCKPGSISFMSQSGGHLSQLLDIGSKRDLRFRYGVSFGNQIDLNCVDFLIHYRKDPETNIIASYLESFGSADGKKFFKELRKTTKYKPVIIWKGGYTEDGIKATFSHTGALASDYRMWKTMANQSGAILVKDNEEFWNSIKTFELLYPEKLPKGRNVAIITPGGGSSVNFTDIFASYGLKIPFLSKQSQKAIAELLPEENVNTKNPIDLGALGFIVNVYLDCVKIVIDDPNIDIIALPLWPHHIFRYVFKRMIKLEKTTHKPFIYCLPSLADSLELVRKFEKAKKILHKNRSLYFFSLNNCAKSITHLVHYSEFLKKEKKKI